MTEELFHDEVKVKHLLKADSFGQIITVYNRENNDKAIKLVEDIDDFFGHVYEEASGGLYVNGAYRKATINNWLKENDNLNGSLNCFLFFIEGYAGCGKSTLVQYILYKVLENQNYEYSYYNYDIGCYPENEIESWNADFIKYSILHKLKDQISNTVTTINGNNIFEKFLILMNDEESLKKLDSTLLIKMNFGTTKSFISAVRAVIDCKDKNDIQNILLLKACIEQQLKHFATYQLLCIDYLWRLSQYLTDMKSYKKYMYVCFDNLDSIMNYDLLCNFKEQLIVFRENLNSYISALNSKSSMLAILQNGITKRIRPFFIFSTYRKITAVRSNYRNTEMFDDVIYNNSFIKIIDVSKQYDFTKIAERRIAHFSSKLNTINICGSRAKNLIEQMEIVNELKGMEFVKNIYAGLWNNNLRSCSNVLSDLIEFYESEINKCRDFCKENFDGHIQDKSCYYGASSLFLYAICKLLNKIKIFDSEHLDLVNIEEDTKKRKTSLSRLIITYLYTKNRSVSITELFRDFDKVFEPRYICKIIGQMLVRVEGEVWRRPIYYSKYALDNEIDIESKLYKQYEKYKSKEEYKYTEFKICDCGETYINAIVPHFEFYSVRINEENRDLYCIEKLEELVEILNSVFEKLKACCEKQIEFYNDYIEKYKIEKSKYLGLPFHPRTRSKNPQLHIERVIFSHIAYFNNYRLYLIKKRKLRKYNKFNDKLIEYIGKYLGLYNEYVTQISNERQIIATNMQLKVNKAMIGDKYISIEA